MTLISNGVKVLHVPLKRHTAPVWGILHTLHLNTYLSNVVCKKGN